ncbi:MAG: DUF523 domain-containing protein [Sneathiellales bacterium]|nr:DUF523 domain-containing protein [Sneathiellales bacterium]
MDLILISSCLLGSPVRYDGKAKTLSHKLIKKWREEGRLISICPEVAAGLPTPRPPAEILEGKSGTDILEGSAVLNEKTGQDVSQAFLKGAHIALDLAIAKGCRFAILTDGSPSCGSSFIYDGSFSGARHKGQGVTTALLEKNGVAVFSEDTLDQLVPLLDKDLSSSARTL